MSSVVYSARMVRVLALALPCLLPLLSGCDLEPYPSDLTYPLRSDPLVAVAPGAETWDTFGPGQLDHHIARLTEFDKSAKTYDPAKLPGDRRQQLEATLRDVFGTPAEPKVVVKDADQETRDALAELKLDEATLKHGSTVYRRHCMHCHGVTGDGRGPTGPWVNPTPRDYRQGAFKFISTDLKVDGRKPRRQDLLRTLEHGIEGTSMPSFALLLDEEKEALVSYIIHLSLRGETEFKTMKPLLDGSGLPGSVREYVAGVLVDPDGFGVLNAWARSNAKSIEPTEYPYKDDGSKEAEEQRLDSVRRGYKLFTDPIGDATCINCHKDFGRVVSFRFDEWGTLVRPANLTAGVYRGGRRPIDLYWRIRGGIGPSKMPRAEFARDDDAKNKARWDHADPYWDLVNFVQALPYPEMLPKDIKQEIYGSREKTAVHAQR